MLFSTHIINPSKNARAADLITGPYPIGLSVDRFLDLFSDVKSFNVNGLSYVDNTLGQNIISTSIIGALQNLSDFNNNATQNSNFVGSSKRKILRAGLLQASGAELAANQLPSSLVDYPLHSAGGPGGSVEINFGKTLISAGLLFPYIRVAFSTGMGSLESGPAVGSVSFENYGIIPIYGGLAVSGAAVGFASGRITIGERYSALRAESLSVARESELVFTSAKPLKSLEIYKRAYFGSAETDVRATATELSVTVPLNAKSGPVRFESDGPQFDSFLSYDDILISS